MNPHTQETAQQATSRRLVACVPRLRASRGRYQSGGTFLGVILGVMAGLAVALGVAIYVAKVPVPFVNKGSTRTSGQDAAEAEKNKDWDPNSALRGRSAGAGRPAAPAVSGVVASEPAPQVIPAPQIAAPAMVPTPAEVKPPARTAEKPAAAASTPTVRAPAATRTPSADPLGDLAAARAGSTSQAVDPFTYFVQAGAFRNGDDAEAQRARLSLMGVESRVTEREQAGRTVYRVRVGPFQNKDAADRIKERLDGNGFDSALVRVQK